MPEPRRLLLVKANQPITANQQNSVIRAVNANRELITQASSTQEPVPEGAETSVPIDDEGNTVSIPSGTRVASEIARSEVTQEVEIRDADTNELIGVADQVVPVTSTLRYADGETAIIVWQT